jgi:hypothetical protein
LTHVNIQSFARSGLRAAAVVGLAALAACESAPEIRSQTAPGANVAAYRTYGYVDKLGTDPAGYTTLNTRFIKEAVDREMQARGYVLAASPDLLVNFNVASKDKVEGTSTGPRTSVAVGYGGWGGWRRGYGYGVGVGIGDTDIRTVTEGTLTIDVVDAARKELLWTGSAVGRLTKAIQADPKPTIDKAVSLIFQKYPKAPAVPPVASGPAAKS